MSTWTSTLFPTIVKKDVTADFTLTVKKEQGDTIYSATVKVYNSTTGSQIYSGSCTVNADKILFSVPYTYLLETALMNRVEVSSVINTQAPTFMAFFSVVRELVSTSVTASDVKEGQLRIGGFFTSDEEIEDIILDSFNSVISDLKNQYKIVFADGIANPSDIDRLVLLKSRYNCYSQMLQGSGEAASAWMSDAGSEYQKLLTNGTIFVIDEENKISTVNMVSSVVVTR